MGIRFGKGAWRRAALVVAIGLPCALLWGVREAASWRPTLLSKLSGLGSQDMAFSPTDSTLALSTHYGGKVELQVWDTRKRQLLWNRQSGPNPGLLAFSPDGKMLAMTNGSSTLDMTLWEPRSGRKIKTLHRVPVMYGCSFQFSADGKSLIIDNRNDFNREVDFWFCDLATGAVHPLLRPSRYLWDSRFAAAYPRTGLAVLKWWGPTLQLWDMRTDKLVRTFTFTGMKNADDVRDIGFSADGSRVFAGIHTNRDFVTVVIWDVATGRVQHSFRIEYLESWEHDIVAPSEFGFALSADNSQLATVKIPIEGDTMLELWRAQ